MSLLSFFQWWLAECFPLDNCLRDLHYRRGSSWSCHQQQSRNWMGSATQSSNPLDFSQLRWIFYNYALVDNVAFCASSLCQQVSQRNGADDGVWVGIVVGQAQDLACSFYGLQQPRQMISHKCSLSGNVLDLR